MLFYIPTDKKSYVCSREVKLLEVLEGDVTGATLVALSNKVHHIGVGWWEGQELGEHRLDLLVRDELTIALIEEAETLFRFFVLTRLCTNALIPMVGHNMLDELEVNAVT